MSNISITLHALYGNKVGLAIEELHRSENDLAEGLLRLADRHRVDHEIYHVARDIARWSQEHVRRLAGVGEDYGLTLDPEPQDEASLAAKLRRKGSELTGRFQAPGLILLEDLRSIHKEAAGVSLDWEILAQTAQAMRNRQLLEVAESCHPETLRQMRWANAKVKETAAQIMVTG